MDELSYKKVKRNGKNAYEILFDGHNFRSFFIDSWLWNTRSSRPVWYPRSLGLTSLSKDLNHNKIGEGIKKQENFKMDMKKKNIEKLPFFYSFTPGSKARAVIDVQAFNLWVEQVQGMEFLSDIEEKERCNAYSELESGHALDLKDAMHKW